MLISNWFSLLLLTQMIRHGGQRLDMNNKSDSSTLAYTQSERLVQEFVSRGLIVLSPDSLGISSDIHEQIFQQELKAYHEDKAITPASIPGMLDVLNAPGLVSVCNQLVGENWAIVPFTHNAPFPSGHRDQHWHKDDNGVTNSRKQRHHQAVQIEMLYYPQTVREDMGPTATIPYSQYWTFNHEENHDNFAGADHLDFDYALSGMERQPVSGHHSTYSVEDIVARRTPHDIRMREAVTNTGWPLVQQFEAAPLEAGSIVIYSHNTFHRGNHRRDDWQTWRDNPRFMWRFWLYRTTDVTDGNTSPVDIRWDDMGTDTLTNIDLSQVDDDISELWRYHYHWIKTCDKPPPRQNALTLTPEAREKEATRLYEQLHTKYDKGEPARISAAYILASIGDAELAVQMLSQALYTERENVRRAATYGLIALGSDATDTLIEATTSPIKWVRKAGVYGLGDASPLTDDVLNAVVERLKSDPSVYVRSVAGGSLGCIARRAIATGVGKSLVPTCMDALVQSLATEDNRLAMDIAQGRPIKFVRPTDDSDVCEGGGVDFGLERFDPVRSAVRENVLWSIVMLCSHGSDVLGSALEPAIQALKMVIREDKNVISVGLAMDALNRLANLHPTDEKTPPIISDLQSDLFSILSESPIQGWEALIRGGLDVEAILQVNQKD